MRYAIAGSGESSGCYNQLEVWGKSVEGSSVSRGAVMKDSYDFSRGARGKFYHPGAEFEFAVGKVRRTTPEELAVEKEKFGIDLVVGRSPRIEEGDDEVNG
jgi:hypothetical protein